ncbi:MAG: helix-turn-helix transcriptional regulator [Chloroflexota bacterium]
MSNTEKITLRNRILGILLLDARQKAGLSEDHCAGKLSVPTDSYQEMELGKTAISLPQLELFAQLTNQPLDHFFGEQLLETRPASSDYLPLRNRIVGALHRQAREEASISLEEMADILQVEPEKVNSYEMGSEPIPYPLLEISAQALDVDVTHFSDQNDASSETEEIAEFDDQEQAAAVSGMDHLSEDLQQLVANPVNTGYLETALRLSKLSAEDLRAVAESLLEITY